MLKNRFFIGQSNDLATENWPKMAETLFEKI